MKERRTPRVAHDERGSAVVEFVVLGVLMLVPLIYLVMMMARLQAGSFAVTQAARELFGNPDPDPTAPVSTAWPLQHPVLYTLLWSVVIVAVFAPLAGAQYRRAASR